MCYKFYTSNASYQNQMHFFCNQPQAVQFRCNFQVRHPPPPQCVHRITIIGKIKQTIQYTVFLFVQTKTLYIVYRVSQEECARLRDSVPYVKVYRYNPKHLYPKLNGYGDNGQRSLKL